MSDESRTMGTSNMGPIGRILRIFLGGYLIVLALPYYLYPNRVVSFLGSTYSSDYVGVLLACIATLGFLAFYLLVHRAATTHFQSLNKWVGAILANIPPLAVFVVSTVLGIGYSQIATFSYVGIAMLVAGWRRDQGCEVMSPTNVVLGNPTQFACLIFSPIDWVEKKARNSSGWSKTNALRPQFKF